MNACATGKNLCKDELINELIEDDGLSEEFLNCYNKKDECVLCGDDNASVNIKGLDICNSCLNGRAGEVPGFISSSSKGEIPEDKMDDTSLIEELATLDDDRCKCDSGKRCDIQSSDESDYKKNDEYITVEYTEAVNTDNNKKEICVSYGARTIKGQNLEEAYSAAWKIVELQIAKKRKEIIDEFGSR
jgi:hypothetical protein